MRLNENTYPAYMQIQRNDLLSLNIDALFKDEILTDNKKFFDFIESIKYTFNQVDETYYVTETFKEAIHIAAPKIIKDRKLFTEIPSSCGVLFTKNGFTLYISNPTDKKLKLLCYGFTRDTLTTYGIIDNDFKYGGAAFTYKGINDTEYLSNYLNGILLAIWFIKNCEIETKVLQPKEKHRQEGIKYYNESKSPITILNCNWFTNLVRDIPFSVKGHFRWQPCGEKLQRRKLIWIEEFEKSGYNRKALKES
jgi:hypothetical protein